jgi:hypothetical protein
MSSNRTGAYRGATIMDLFQATEATHWAERRYREELARAGRGHLTGRPDRIPRSNASARMLVAHPMPVAAVMALLMALLVVAAI